MSHSLIPKSNLCKLSFKSVSSSASDIPGNNFSNKNQNLSSNFYSTNRGTSNIFLKKNEDCNSNLILNNNPKPSENYAKSLFGKGNDGNATDKKNILSENKQIFTENSSGADQLKINDNQDLNKENKYISNNPFTIPSGIFKINPSEPITNPSGISILGNPFHRAEENKLETKHNHQTRISNNKEIETKNAVTQNISLINQCNNNSKEPSNSENKQISMNSGNVSNQKFIGLKEIKQSEKKVLSLFKKRNRQKILQDYLYKIMKISHL